MFNRNEYFDHYFKELLEPEETYNHYFYVMSFAPLTKYLLFQEASILANKHLIVSFTNKRILICEMDAVSGKLTGNIFPIDLNSVKDISIKKGFLKTKVKIKFSDDSETMFKPNNFCLGLSNHKNHLIKLTEKYQ